MKWSFCLYALWSDTNVKQNMILKIAIRFYQKDLFVLKMS